jgi:tetratricopeptide (TPR) repeat protein
MVSSEKRSGSARQEARTPGHLHPGFRLWLFRFLVVIGLPCLLLAGLEGSLRLADYGYPTTYFIPKQIDGQAVLVENSQFGWRFFPPAIARTPPPTVMSAEKPTGQFRIFLFGESAAMGDPRPAFGVGRYLEVLLNERFPGTRFEVVGVAMTAINAHAMPSIARECARYQGDFWIVYAGNNEMAGPFGANTVFGPQTPSAAFVQGYLAIQRTRLGQWLVSQFRRLGSPASTPESWGGLKMFRENQLAPHDPRKARVEQNFHRNLESLILVGQRAKVPILLCGMAVNLKDCAPFASLHSPPLKGEALARWQTMFQALITNAAPQNWDTSALLALDQQSPGYAELHYRLGQSYLATTNPAKAWAHFRQARDFDALPFRADSAINAIVAETAARHAGNGVDYLDAEKVLAEASPARIPGREFFLEHAHLNFTGNYILARAMAEQIRARLPAAITSPTAAEWADAEVCAARLGLTDWNRVSAMEDIAKRLADAPYLDQCDHAVQNQAFLGQLADLKKRLSAGAAAAARQVYETAIQRRPQDHWLRHNYAEFLAATGDGVAATAQMSQVRALIPHHYMIYIQLGRLLARQNQLSQAQKILFQAIPISPTREEAYLELSYVEAAQGQLEAALHHLDVAQRFRPSDAQVPLRRADILAAHKKRPEAILSLREAIRLRPAAWEIHYRLAVELAADEQTPAAQTEFETVLRLRPDHVLARLNQGNMLARQNRYDEARACFEEALRLEPSNENARKLLRQLERVIRQ